MADQLPSRAVHQRRPAAAALGLAESDPVSAAVKARIHSSRLRKREFRPRHLQERRMSKNITAPLVDVSDLPIEKAVARLIEYAATLSASDLFLISEPTALSAQVRHLGHVKK